MEEKEPLTLKKKIIRTTIVVLVICGLLLLLYYTLVWTGAWEYINSVEKIRQLILSLGFWGRFTFVLLQFLQVTFLPIPSTVSTLAGVLIYGPLEAALLSFAGIMLGSVLAFWLGRQFGRKLVEFMVGKSTCEKWTKFLSNCKYSFFIMMLLPVFPDDVLCLVAGLTNMSWTFFIVTNVISRPLAIFTTCYIGSGTLIPYHGWGLAVWAVIVIVVAILIYLSFKYRPQIENFLQKTFMTKKERERLQKVNQNKEAENVETSKEETVEVEEKKPEDKADTEEKESPTVEKPVKSAKKKPATDAKNSPKRKQTATRKSAVKPKAPQKKKVESKKE